MSYGRQKPITCRQLDTMWYGSNCTRGTSLLFAASGVMRQLLHPVCSPRHLYIALLSTPAKAPPAQACCQSVLSTFIGLSRAHLVVHAGQSSLSHSRALFRNLNLDT